MRFHPLVGTGFAVLLMLPWAVGCSQACGDTTCGASEYCILGVTGDGISQCDGRTGLCAPRPTSCDDTYAPICGWDGKVYGNACEAHAAGVELSPYLHDIPCPESATPADLIPCDGIYCNPKVSYCEVTWGDTCDFNRACRELPSKCAATPTCACLEGELGNWSYTCKEVQGNGVTGLRIDDSAG